jgi:ketosteroid isomerase-like protein
VRRYDQMKIDYVILVVSLVGFLVGCRASDEEQIRGIIQGGLQAYGEEDIDKVMSYMSETCERRMPYGGGETVTGKDAVRSSYTAEFARMDDIEITGDIISIKVSGDTATAVYNWQMEVTDLDLQENGVRVIVTGKTSDSLRKIDGIWKVTVGEDTIDTWERQE